MGGEQTVLRRGKDGAIRSRIVGPDHALLRAGGRMTLPFTLTIAADGRARAARDRGGRRRSTLAVGEYTRLGGAAVHGRARRQGARDREVLPDLGRARGRTST